MYAYAQEVVQTVQAIQEVANVADPVIKEVSMGEFLMYLFQSLNGLKGAGALGVAGVLVQVLIKFLGSPVAKYFFKNQSGGVKLLIAAFLSVAAGIVSLIIAGVTLPAALVHGSTLAAYSVLAHQIYKQFFKKKVEEDKPSV